MKYLCGICGVAAQSNRCWRHKPKKPIKKSPIRKTSKPLTEEKKEEKNKMRAFFFWIWENYPRCSEISNTKFYGEVRSYYYHHLKCKSIHKDIQYSISNIIRVTLDEHSIIESDNDYYPIVKERIKFIEENYEQCKKESEEFERVYELNKEI